MRDSLDIYRGEVAAILVRQDANGIRHITEREIAYALDLQASQVAEVLRGLEDDGQAIRTAEDHWRLRRTAECAAPSRFPQARFRPSFAGAFSASRLPRAS